MTFSLIIWSAKALKATKASAETSEALSNLLNILNKSDVAQLICTKTARAGTTQKDNADIFGTLACIDISSFGTDIVRLIQHFKLTPANVLVLVESKMTIAEVRFHCPDLLVCNPAAALNLIKDRGFTQTSGILLRESLKSFDVQARGQNANILFDRSFLIGCEIKIYIENAIERDLQMAIDFLRKPSPLNCLGETLPDNDREAQTLLLDEIANHEIFAGFVTISHQYLTEPQCVGVYVMYYGESGTRALLRYAFTEDIIGLGVESWLYKKLGTPDFWGAHEASVDFASQTDIDWITEVTDASCVKKEGETQLELNHLILRGGCAVRAISHHLERHFTEIHNEMNVIIDEMSLRSDHMVFMDYALNGISKEFQTQFYRLDLALNISAPGCLDLQTLSIALL